MPNVLITGANRGMRRFIEQFDLRNTGRFVSYDGTPMPW